jgi:hypothetical protein
MGKHGIFLFLANVSSLDTMDIHLNAGLRHVDISDAKRKIYKGRSCTSRNLRG